MQRLFGTDGIRGVADKFPLDPPTVGQIGGSLARLFSERLGRTPRFVIGRDTRESGTRLENAIGSGLIAAGGDIETAGVITTPGVAFITREFAFDAGIVISASHNPYEDNGVKVFLPAGTKLDEASENRIEREVRKNGASAPPQLSAQIDTSRKAEFHAAYADHFAERFNGLNLTNRKIVLDCANGAASELAPEIFRKFGADVVAINVRPDGRNINHQCGSLHLEALRDATLAARADFGVAYDGDADRSLLVDGSGRIFDGDAILWIIAGYFMKRGTLSSRSVVATVMSNIGLELGFAARGIKLIRAAVGDKYVLEELLRTGSELGGEQSGHIIVPKESLVGDGIATSLFVMAAVAESGQQLAELIEGFVAYPQTLVNVSVREKKPFDSVANITAVSSMIEDELNGKGRLLLRYSGTENLARIMIEGEDQRTIEIQAKRLADTISSELG